VLKLLFKLLFNILIHIDYSVKIELDVFTIKADLCLILLLNYYYYFSKLIFAYFIRLLK